MTLANPLPSGLNVQTLGACLPIAPKSVLNQSEASKMNARKFSLFAKRESFLFHFIYPYNSYQFYGIPQIYVAADKNKINNPVLL